jgi:hypothetical protein
MNLPFKKGAQLEIIISKMKKKKNLKKLVCNDHIWSEEDIKAVKAGRTIINQWKIS